MENFNQYPVGIERVLTASEFMLFTVMYNQWRLMKNENDYYFRSIEDLTNDCTLSCATIKRALKVLKDKGIFNSISGSKKLGHANEYRFNLEVILSLINDNLKSSNCSNKKLNLSHHKEIKTKEKTKVKYIYHTGISSNENESNEIKNNLNMIQDQTNNLSMENKVKINSNEMKDMKVVNEKSNNVANVMNNNEKNNNNLSSDPVNISDTSNFEISENEGIEVVNEKSNNVANVMNGTDTLKENYSHNISVDNDIKTVQSTTQQFSVSTKNINLKGSAAVGGGAENLRNGAGSVILSEVKQLPTATEKSDNTAPSYSNTEYNGEIDMFYLHHGITREEYEEAQRSFIKTSWRSLPCKLNGKTLTMSKVLDKLNEKDKDGKQPREANTYFFIIERLERYAQHYLKNGQMSQADFNEYDKVVTALSTPYFAYWKKVFENRMPNKMNPSEISMWKLLGCPQPSKNTVEATEKDKVVQHPTTAEKTQNTEPSYSNTVTLPSLKELYKMSVADAEQTIFDFAANNTNIPLKDKVYFNENICGAFGISPQYVI
ncbi:MAG: hypothetical protein SOY92_05595 [Prevotella sp.]|nr:hypothetical protein [Prevotella sp.]MDY3945456.1 hypothetical protein [Prevotella sp.]